MQLPYSNLQLQHWNPGAQNALILPIHVICNTSDEALFDNIRTNSARPGQWIKTEAAHDGIAVLCGSGPSITDDIDQIKALQAHGGKVFAMNGCAKFLCDNGIMPDYQCIVDAREETAELIGPAMHHLFASQVHPKCFEKAPNAIVWQLQIEGIDEIIDHYEDSYCLIGGSASVGNASTCLAYAMGYRNLQIFGYDSSHRGTDSHAFHQKMNDGDPCASVRFAGKDYIVSLTMKLQAEKFQDTARDLKQLGCFIEVHGTGLLPDMYNHPKEVMTEKEKYQRLWSYNEYRDTAPGESLVDTFIKWAEPDKGSTIIDFGCGTGRAGVKLAEAGLDVMLVDFTDNSRDLEAVGLRFTQHDITLPLTIMTNNEKADYGFCTDMMEHIPPDDVDTVIHNIMGCCTTAFFQISTVPDVMGSIIGQDLHLTVMPFNNWYTLFKQLGYKVMRSKVNQSSVLFLITKDKQ